MPQSILQQAIQSREKEEQQQQLQQAPQIAPIDQDRAAKIFYVQGKTRLPSDVIDADLDNLYEQVKRNEFDYKNYTDEENGAPIFNEWAASNPYHPAIVERDRRHLSLIERQLDTLGRGYDRGVATVEMSRIQNRRRAGDHREGDEEVIAELDALIKADQFGLDSAWAGILVETGAQSRIMGEILGESLKAGAQGAATFGATGLAVGAGAGSLVTGLAGAKTGFLIGSVMGGFDAARRLEQGLAYGEYIELGASEEDAKRISGYVGVANAAFEMVGIAAITKYIPGVKKLQGSLGKTLVERMFSKPTVAGAHRTLVARYGEVMATEIFTEVMQESITMAGSEYLKRNMREAGDMRPELAPMSMDEYLDAIGDIAVKTLQGTVFLGAAGPGMSYVGDLRRARNAKATGVYLKSIGEASTDTEMRKDPRIAPKFKEFFQAQAEKGPVKEVLFDIEAWTDYWEAQGLDVDEVSRELGIDLEKARAQGPDVVIDLETFGEKFAHTDHFNKELWKDAKLQSDQFSYREAVDFMNNTDEHIEKIKADLSETFGVEVSDDFERIADIVTQELVQNGNMTESAAKPQAQLMASVFTTQALRNPEAGITPWELFTNRFGGVVRQFEETAAPRGTVDLRLDPLLDAIRSGDIPTDRQIFGDSLVDFVMQQGGLVDDGGELSARDYKTLKRGLIKSTGNTLDGMAELAYEQGYISSRDPNLLLEMMDRELQQDQPVFSRQQSAEGQALQTRAEDLNQLSEYLESEGLDVATMTNEEIRKALANRRTFQQQDDQTLSDLTELLLATLGNPNASQEYARDLMRLEAMIPRISEEQDFGDLEFTDRVQLKGRPGTRKRKAQKAFDVAVKKRNSLKKLMDCMGGS